MRSISALLAQPEYTGVNPGTKSAISIALLALMFAASSLKHLFFPFNHDNAVHIHAARTILENGSLYRHFFETNPPLFPWLTLLPTLAGDVSGVSVFFFYRAMIYLVAAGALVLVALDLKRLGVTSARSGMTAILLFWAALLIGLQNYDFGQRDHLIAVLVFPFTINLAVRLQSTQTGRLTVPVALLLAIGIAIKPQFIFIWMLGESAVMLRHRSMRSVISLPNLLVVLLGGSYIAAVLVLEPAYFSDIMPLLRQTYGTFKNPLSQSTVFIWLSFTLLQLIVLRALSGGRDPSVRTASLALATACLVTAQGGFLGYLVQAHFPYQLWPFIILSCASLAALLLPMVSEVRSTRAVRAAVAVSFLGVIAATPSWVWPQTIAVARGHTTMQQVRAKQFPALQSRIDLINRYAAGDSFYVFSTNVSAVFPVALYADAEWSHRYHTLWPLPALAISEISLSSTETQDAAIELVVKQVTEDFANNSPALVLVDVSETKSFFPVVKGKNHSFDYLDFFQRSDAFHTLFSAYTPCGSVPTPSGRVFEVYLGRNVSDDLKADCSLSPSLSSRS